MKRKKVLIIAAMIASAFFVVTNCTPTSPDAGQNPRKKGSKSSSSASSSLKQAVPETKRPGGHRNRPLPFALAVGVVGQQSARPFGVWQKMGNDMRIIQDNLPGFGSSAPDDKGTLIFEDSFDRQEIGDDWRIGGGKYFIRNGSLTSDYAHNENIFLKKPLPRNVRIEFDAWSETDRLDFKVSLYDDGLEHESGYVALLGGWYNSTDALIRGREHDHESVARKTIPWIEGGRPKAGQKYKWTLIRKDSKLSWYLENKLYLEYDDPAPLYGEANKYFSVSNWESVIHLDNLKIYEIL